MSGTKQSKGARAAKPRSGTRPGGEASKGQAEGEAFEGERIAKVLARAGVASRRGAEALIAQGRVSVNGRTLKSPAFNVRPDQEIAVDGEPLPAQERARLFRYHKPPGLIVTRSDPEGRPTIFERLPRDLPLLNAVGRLDLNSEGLLLLTNDGGLKRTLEMPATGWTRRYRVRAHGQVDQRALDRLRRGITVDGVRFGPIEARLEEAPRGSSAGAGSRSNVWITVALKEGKNREVRRALATLGLEVNRLIRTAYGPFQLGGLRRGEVAEVPPKMLREQLGGKLKG
ncbi:MAG: pseudouridine synthase [Maricaulaceae bacterium]|jgi:23S rRNA pseudouridine2605 synthase